MSKGKKKVDGMDLPEGFIEPTQEQLDAAAAKGLAINPEGRVVEAGREQESLTDEIYTDPKTNQVKHRPISKVSDIYIVPIPKQFVLPIGYFESLDKPKEQLKKLLNCKLIAYDDVVQCFYLYFSRDQVEDIELAEEVACGWSFSHLIDPALYEEVRDNINKAHAMDAIEQLAQEIEEKGEDVNGESK